jgi:hypothetical protein
MKIEIEEAELHRILSELNHLRHQCRELQENQTKLVNEARANDLSCQLRKEFELLRVGERPGLLSEFNDSDLDRSLADLALDLTMSERTLEEVRLKSGIPRREVGWIVHEAVLAGTPRQEVICKIDSLLREGGYRGR